MDKTLEIIANSKDYDGFFGLVSLALVLLSAVAASGFAWFQLQRAGRQKIAEARLGWAETYRTLAVKLDTIAVELARLQVPGKLSGPVRRRRLQLEARTIAIGMLLMVHPEGNGTTANDEYDMEKDLTARLARLGVEIDMIYIRQQRKVLKHNWNAVKKEFWRKTYF